jgi:hypothetical protein
MADPFPTLNFIMLDTAAASTEPPLVYAQMKTVAAQATDIVVSSVTPVPQFGRHSAFFL